MDLYIPSKIVVGFQTRSDTYTGKLAYVIYRDHKNVLRKEKSWNSWRDHKIEFLEFDNVPTANFTLNKGVQRSREWFGTGRSMVRVYDQRDFEFEITIDNLLNVLAHADVSKRDITEPCVYAWQGTNLVLLPTNSEEYRLSLAHTSKQSISFKAKDLVIGHTYSILKDSTTSVVYLGRLDRYKVEQEYVDTRYNGIIQTLQKKKHVFVNPVNNEIYARDASGFIAGCISEEVHSNFADLCDMYYKTCEASPIVGLDVDRWTPETIERYFELQYYSSACMWVEAEPNVFVRVDCDYDSHASRYDTGRLSANQPHVRIGSPQSAQVVRVEQRGTGFALITRSTEDVSSNGSYYRYRSRPYQYEKPRESVERLLSAIRLMQQELSNKVTSTPEEARQLLRETMLSLVQQYKVGKRIIGVRADGTRMLADGALYI